MELADNIEEVSLYALETVPEFDYYFVLICHFSFLLLTIRGSESFKDDIATRCVFSLCQVLIIIFQFV